MDRVATERDVAGTGTSPRSETDEMMVANYKRRKPSLVRNLWIYRRLIVVALLGGIVLWFIWANRKPVEVSFPFGLGIIQSSVGILILASTATGAVVGGLAMTAWLALRKSKATSERTEKEPVDFAPDIDEEERTAPLKDKYDQDLPPPDYASRTPEGFSQTKW